MAFPIQIPNDAPFTAEQRAWLNDFLSKALALGAQQAAAASGPSVPVTVLYGSQTGTAEGLAKKLVKSLKKGNFEVELHDMAAYDRARLAGEKNLLIITSTYGDGEPPDSAAELHGWLLGDSAPQLPALSYSVLALGDSSYPDFCKCGIEFDTRLAALGAKRISARVDVDVDPDGPYAEWSAAVIATLAPGGAGSSGGEASADSAETGFSKTNPFPAGVVENYNLNGAGEKQTNQIALTLEGSGLEYEVGDALGVYPLNPPQVVDEIIANLPFKAGDVPAPNGGEVSLREALIRYYDIGSLNKSIIQKWQAKSGSPFLRSLVEADDKKAYDDFCWGRDLIDLVIDHPADFTDGEEFVSILKKLQPRLYSIASSPRAHPGEVHLCVGIVRYESFGRKRGGICSTFLADRLTGGEKPRVYVHGNNAFRLPADTATDVIMCGPGTGIAPFRAFLEDRKATAATGRNWLFFGNPHQATDYLYQDEIESYIADGTLTKFDAAWSRDQKEKLYVQHLMVRNGAELWAWLSKGAAFYVCGDASRMAKDVDAALHKVAEEHGNLTAEEATAFISQLKKEKRYLRDVY
ncbi:flavodoxin domain-containing protein [Luteolibacter yonseiensis]|uniref:assimilatory sulfite reductase (NADPH) n=1 Tax=Luteolibacter yonseiensis TaxID=1144680 RepID=A0A934VBP0_9BACT|nr:flavodoxin domain-containing protein [Luteolibacter yonseiensis]MBK1816141.1 flavodoxin domain-containing protein [Luteolibacter yonseiensis]